MRNRLLAVWLVVPLAAAGTLTAHGVAYWILGASSEGVHGYLSHVPLVLIALLLPALLAIAVTERAPTPSAWPFPAAALAAFAAQEHLERLAHTGQVPFLLDRPVFWLGLGLQVPFALAALLVARLLVRAVHVLRRAPIRLEPRSPAFPPAPRSLAFAVSWNGRPAAPRGPPVPLLSG